jgi:dCMP deaminase
MSKIDWDRRFLKMASGEINSWSKDPSTKVSATIFRGKYPIAISYNGFPPGIEDTNERLNNRELKYKLVQHAEANAIATCARLGITTEGTTMAVTHFPCSTCAGLMISAGIAKVVVQKPSEDFLSRWKESIELSKDMFKEAGVEVVEIDITQYN